MSMADMTCAEKIANIEKSCFIWLQNYNIVDGKYVGTKILKADMDKFDALPLQKRRSKKNFVLVTELDNNNKILRIRRASCGLNCFCAAELF